MYFKVQLTRMKSIMCILNYNRFEIVQKLNYKYILCPSSVKDAHLVWYLKNFPSKSVIIFTSKRNTANRLTKTLNLLEIPAVTIHSELAQGLRTENLDKFRTGTIQCLVSTGVVSRGVDIPTCELVINYDIPSCVREFIHRSGRTARAGRGGIW